MNLDVTVRSKPRKKLITPLTPEEELFVAIDHGDVDSALTWIERGASLHSKWEGWTPLSLACEKGEYSVIEILIPYLLRENRNQRKSNGSFSNIHSILDEYDEHGNTPLACAARNGHLKICKILVDQGACINQTTQYVRQSILHLAIENNHIQVVGFLLKNGADVQVTDNVKISPLYTAIKGCNPVIVQKLIDAGCDVNIGSQDHSPLFLATRLGLFPVVQMLCERGCNKDLALSYGVTPVYEATLKGHTDILGYLIDQGCDVNKTDMYGVSALHIACMYGNVTLVDMLLRAGANPSIRMQQGQSALHVAMESNKADIVEFLLMQGADILVKPYGSKSLSSIAAVFDRGHKETVEVLLRGCPCLPLPHYPGVTEMFSQNAHLMKMLFLSGIQTIPGVLTVARLHPRYISDKEISTWLQNFRKNPQSLRSLCRIRIRRCLGNKTLYSVNCLPLPSVLKDFICLKDL